MRAGGRATQNFDATQSRPPEWTGGRGAAFTGSREGRGGGRMSASGGTPEGPQALFMVSQVACDRVQP